MNTRMQSWIIKSQRTYVILLFLFLIIGSYATAFAQGEQKTTEGLQLILKPVKSDFVMGEAIDMRLDIQNIKSEPIVIIKPEINRILLGWSLAGYVSAPGGKKNMIQPSILYEMDRFLQKEDFIQLKPGEKTSIEIHFDSPIQRYEGKMMSQWAVAPIFDAPVRDDILKECFSHTGEYTIKFILENTIDKYFEFIDDKGHVREVKVDAWIGKISSNEIKIRITNEHSN